MSIEASIDTNIRLDELTEKTAEGAQASLYLYKGKAVKLFKAGYDESGAENELALQRLAYESGLPVPNVYGLAHAGGRIAIIMDYVKGETIGEIALRDIKNVNRYIDMMSDIQIEVHKRGGKNFPSQKERLEHRIMAANQLSAVQKEGLLTELSRLGADETLCHGDFHAQNLISTDSGVVIIDWVDATRGSRAADVCRTYLLYAVSAMEVARPYMETYCRKAGLVEDEIMQWLPIVAAARLPEVRDQKEISKLIYWATGNKL